MRFSLAALFACLILAPPALAQEADEEQRPFADVKLQPDGEGVVVTVVLDAPVERFVFEQADVVRDDALSVLTPGLAFADDAITGAEPFASFGFRLAEDYSERDAKYPPFYRVGEGYLVFAPAILPEDDRWDTALHIDTLPEGWVRWPEDPLPQGYVFFGPQEMVSEQGGVRFVFDGNGGPAFEAEIRDSVSRSLTYLEEVFGSPPASAPFVATSVLESERARRYTGDVTEGAMIALRFFDSAFDPTEPEALQVTRSIVLHEGVHFWNGGVASFASGTPQWLHEGGAEYLATLGSYRLGWSNRGDVQARFGQWLDRCSTSLSYSQEPALNELRILNASLRYSCGPLLHALAELYLAEAGPPMTVAEGWRQTVALAAEERGGEYDLDLWLDAMGAPGLLEEPAMAAILSRSGPERWDTVRSEMRRLGVEIALETSPPLRARTALMHLIRSQCTQLAEGEGYGFYSGTESYRLDTPAGCGLLAGGPVIDTLGGYPLTGLTGENYADLQAVCLQGGSIAFGVTEGSVIEVPCISPLPDAATETVITALPDIPAFSE